MIGCLRTRVRKQAIIVLYFESETVLKFYNLEARYRYNQVPHLTQDTICESDKNTRKHHMLESQVASPVPAGDHNASRNTPDPGHHM